ncbi:uncharacterized protein [Montipora capricornis]|uniref:uncharacterized protein n=1 Tax=Montipora capricornis TaxID=246305 RepID=UPI0035F18900
MVAWEKYHSWRILLRPYAWLMRYKFKLRSKVEKQVLPRARQKLLTDDDLKEDSLALFQLAQVCRVKVASCCNNWGVQMTTRTILLISCLICQDFFHGAEGGLNSGFLILNSGEVLEINTTVPSIEKINCTQDCNFNASLKTRNSSFGDHVVASTTFSDDIELRNGSAVRVYGKYALSVTSQNGHILIQTDIDMTCDRDVLDTTCLGGFTQTSKANKMKPDNANLYRGGGPGTMRLKKNIPITSICTPGSSHGGKASKGVATVEEIVVGPEYDKENLASLHGGSAGSCINVQGSVAGGGAIELVSEKKSISINASIRASAQSSASAPCSGGSGGLIRLRAQKVSESERR